MRKPPTIDKADHIEAGLQIKIILSPFGIRKSQANLWNLIPGTVHTIVNRPSRKAKRNGNFGVWINDVNDEPAFVRVFMYVPFVEPLPMLRTKQTFLRTKHNSMQRTKN